VAVPDFRPIIFSQVCLVVGADCRPDCPKQKYSNACVANGNRIRLCLKKRQIRPFATFVIPDPGLAERQNFVACMAFVKVKQEGGSAFRSGFFSFEKKWRPLRSIISNGN
jgi:hypothetical protein